MNLWMAGVLLDDVQHLVGHAEAANDGPLRLAAENSDAEYRGADFYLSEMSLYST